MVLVARNAQSNFKNVIEAMLLFIQYTFKRFLDLDLGNLKEEFMSD